MADQLLGSDAENDLPSQPAALIITPTRELALQVKTELDWLYAETDLVLASAVGGMDIRTERRALSGRVDVLIGTPGRLVDHLNRNSLIRIICVLLFWMKLMKCWIWGFAKIWKPY